MSITHKVIHETKSKYYSTLKLVEIKEENASFVPVQNALYVSFVSPVPVAKKDIMFGKWDKTYDVNIDTCKKIYKDHYQVVFHISLQSGGEFIIESVDSITIGLNSASGTPDLSNLEAYMHNIAIAADKAPSIGGTINLIAAKAPSPDLNDATIDLEFLYNGTDTSYSQNILPGQNLSLDVLAGPYTISAAGIHNNDGTIYNEITCTPSSIDVANGSHNEVHIAYGKQTKYSLLNFNIEEIRNLKGLKFTVSVQADNYHKSFTIPADNMVTLRQLPATGNLAINIAPINNNNEIYSFKPKNITLSGKVEDVLITAADFDIETIHDADFAPLALKITTELDLPNNFQLLELTNADRHYSALIEIKANDFVMFPVTLIPGEYEVSCANFILDKTVYAIKFPEKLKIISALNTLELNIQKGANLVVRGFADNALTFGGCATLEPSNMNYFLEAMPSSIFKYAGNGGNGDPSEILDRDNSTTNTIALARAITAQSSLHQPVLPVMISYTIELSGGNIEVLNRQDDHIRSLANYILTLNILNKSKDAEHPVPGGVIVNPDFLSFLLQQNISPTYPMNVNTIFTEAIKTRAGLLDAIPTVPTHFTQDVKGYIEALNWLTHTIAPDVTYGWQVNLWGIEPRGAVWIYDEKPNTEYLVKILADYLNKLGVYNSAYKPDFLAVDRYEADDLTIRAYGNNYCYGPKEWDEYFNFCSILSFELKLPIMPWQIPASRTPLLNDNVNDNFDTQHWGTAANYLFGDEALGNNVENIHPKVRNFSFKDHGHHGIATYVGNTPGDMFKRKKGFDLSTPSYLDFPLKGIFHVELGGGSTVGMVPALGAPIDMSWSNNKLKAYAKNPVTFADTLNNAKS